MNISNSSLLIKDTHTHTHLRVVQDSLSWVTPQGVPKVLPGLGHVLCSRNGELGGGGVKDQW